MLLLFETAAGLGLFKVLDEERLKQTDNLWKEFETPDKASQIVQLVCFRKFKDVEEAVESASAAVEGRLGKELKKMLKKNVLADARHKLAVSDAKLGSIIKEKTSIACVTSEGIAELMRGIRTQLDSLVAELPRTELAAMQLGLAHSLSRYRLKFSADKVDTMIVQAVSLLDDLDKELNNYVMRCREWYGWHFPELAKLIADHQAFAKTVKAIGKRHNARTVDLGAILPAELEAKVKEEATISMGTDISDNDVENITALCDQIISVSSYRGELHDYLRNRMATLAPNLTALAGELVGARLISHAGSLLGLAKQPASTIQILGAEKALFRALKSKRDTPKYGLIYHAQLLGQAHPKIKGKVSRALAAKLALAVRVDALTETPAAGDGAGDECKPLVATVGLQHRAYLERRIAVMKDAATRRISGQQGKAAQRDKYTFKSDVVAYDDGADSTIAAAGASGKRHFKQGDDDDDEEEEEEQQASAASAKKKAKLAPAEADDDDEGAGGEAEKPKKKKKRSKPEPEAGAEENGEQSAAADGDESLTSSKKKKKKKQKEVKVEDEGDD